MIYHSFTLNTDASNSYHTTCSISKNVKNATYVFLFSFKNKSNIRELKLIEANFWVNFLLATILSLTPRMFERFNLITKPDNCK